MEPSKTDLLLLALYCFTFGLWGSFARTLADNRDTGIKGWLLISLLLKNAVISSFCGMLALPLAQAMHLGQFWTVSIAGLAGYMGVGFLALAEIQMRRRLGIDADANIDN